MQEVNDKHILWDEQIDKFLRGQMTAEEEQSFLASIESDKEKKAYVTTTTLLIDGICEHGAKADEAVIKAAQAASKEDIYAAAGKQKPVWRRLGSIVQKNGWISSAVAIAAVFICVFVINKSNNAEGTYESEISYSSARMEDYTRGAENEELSSSLTRLKNNVDAGRYIASSIVELEEMYQKASDDFTDDEDEYRKDIGLYLAKAYAINGQKEDAKRILEELQKVYPKDKEISEELHQLTK